MLQKSSQPEIPTKLIWFLEVVAPANNDQPCSKKVKSRSSLMDGDKNTIDWNL